MIAIEAIKTGRKEIMRSTCIVLLILFIILFIDETSGDLANGILFFISAILNIEFIIALLLLFGLTYYLSGRAGLDIILEKKNYILASLKYVSIISFIISIYVILLVFINRDRSYTTVNRILFVYLLPMFCKTEISILIAWLWATRKIKLQTKSPAF